MPRPLSRAERLRDHYIRVARVRAALVRRYRNADEPELALEQEILMIDARTRAAFYDQRVEREGAVIA